MMYPERCHSTKTNLPFGLIEKMDLLGLMIWYMDDGYAGTTKSGFVNGHHKSPMPHITAKGYKYEELCQVAEILNKNHDLHLYVRQTKHRDGWNKKVMIPKKDWMILFPLWTNYAKEYNLPECMLYKFNLHEWDDAAKVISAENRKKRKFEKLAAMAKAVPAIEETMKVGV